MPRILKNWEQNIIWPMVWSSRTNLRSAYCCSQQRAPSLLPECCLWHFTGMIIPHTGFAMLVNRRNRKHRSSVHFRKLLRYRGNEDTWYTAFPQHTTAIMEISPPRHNFRMHNFGFVDANLRYNIDHNCSQPCSENKEIEGLWNNFCLFCYYHKTWFDFRIFFI